MQLSTDALSPDPWAIPSVMRPSIHLCGDHNDIRHNVNIVQYEKKESGKEQKQNNFLKNRQPK